MRDAKKCHALRFFDVILFSTWQKTMKWSESVHKWPIKDNRIRLIWNRSVWLYKWGRHYGHWHSRQKIQVLHHEINNVCCTCTVAEISCRHVGIGVQSWWSSITWLLLWPRREWLSSPATREKNIKAKVPDKTVIYFCSEMAATETFVMEDSLHRRILKCI